MNNEENVFNDDNAKNELLSLGNDQPKSLGKVETDFDRKQKSIAESREMAKKIGYRKLDIKTLPSRGKFNGDGMIIEYRPLTLGEIKDYSTQIDDADELSINEELNNILKKCIRIKYPDSVGTYKDIIDYDRLFLIFMIRDVSMENQQKERKMYQESRCKCGEITIKKEITSNEFSYIDLKNLDKFYDESIRGFRFISDEHGIDLKFYIPSIGVFEEIKKYINNKIRKNYTGKDGFYDQKFLDMYQFMVRDWRTINEKHIDGAYNKWKNNTGVDESSLIITATKFISKLSINSEIDMKCDKSGCMEVIRKPIIFQDGYRHLFDFSDIVGGIFADAFRDVD